MPFDGKQLDELLSGFVDGELTDEEREQVEQAARVDVRVAQQIEALRRQAQWVQRVGQLQLSQVVARTGTEKQGGTEKQSGDAPARRAIAAAVIAEAQQRGRELGLPATHHVRLGAGDGGQLPAAVADVTTARVSSRPVAKGPSRRIEAWLAVGGLAAAAAVLVAVTWPKLRQPGPSATPSSQLAQLDDQPTTTTATPQSELRAPDQLEDAMGLDELAPALGRASSPVAPQTGPMRKRAGSEAEDASGSSLVGMSDGLAYALVVDVELTARAEKSRVLEKLLTAVGIPLAPPIAVNAQIRKALDDSRLVVRDPDSGGHAVSIQVVRGGLDELDGVLRKVWQDSDNFPNVGLNLSIDSRAALMREMLRSSGERFTPKDRFAVPLAFARDATPELGDFARGDSAAGRAGPLMAADAGVQYVSSAQRERGWESLGELPGATSGTLATILLVIHYAD